MGFSQSKNYRGLQSPSDTVSVTFQYGSINGSIDADADTHEALITGTSLGGRMSAVRRFFCLLTTFDFLFTIFLWFVCAMLNGETPGKALENEVKNYSIQTSLFDIVLVSAIRFALILIVYAMFRVAHWWLIAITTAGTGAFIITKVFFYTWRLQANPLVPVFLLMCSFIISWGEAWFLDFRVMPYEDKASVLLAKHVNERTGLLPPPRPTSPAISDMDCFYSPQGSETESDNEESPPLVSTLTPEDIACKNRAQEHLEIALSLMQDGNWRTEKIIGSDMVQSLKKPPYGKVFKFVGNVNISASALFEEFINCENSSWNPTVKLVQRIQMIDENSDVVYVVANEGGGGLVSGRDFVNARIWHKHGNAYVIGFSSSNHHNLPSQKGVIRGDQGPSAYIFTPSPDSSYCQFQWLLNTSLKGWIPQYVIDQALCGVMIDFVSSLRRYLAARGSSEVR